MKDTSKDLHARLADRLHMAAERKIAPLWLAVKAGGHGFLLPLSQSGEIYPWVDPHRVPHTKDWFLGVVNLRGALCGVASLAKYVDLDNQTQPHLNMSAVLSAHVQDRRLVAFHPAFELNTVFAVDQLAGLKSADQMTATLGADIYLDDEQQIWQQIDLALLAHNSRFMSIEAQ